MSAHPTDRLLDGPSSLEVLRYDDRGLLPVVAQDAADGRVLMVAWANREALLRTFETGWMHYWSRSRSVLWKKGETSGHLQEAVSLHADCDGDTVLAVVRSRGPACHTGDATCFGGAGSDVVSRLREVVEARDRERPEGSYTTRLLADENLRLKKLGEEAVELVVALVRKEGRAAEEAADLLYHLVVALHGAGIPWEEVLRELDRRRG